MVQLLVPRHSPPKKLVLVCVRGAMTDIDALCDCTILNTDSTVYIYLNNRKRSFSGTVQLSINAIVGDQHLVTYLIIMRDSQSIFSCIFLSESFCFLGLIASQSAMNLTFNNISLPKSNWPGVACRVV